MKKLIKIDSRIPIPTRSARPFKSMRVGDSFFDLTTPRNLFCCGWQFIKNHKLEWKFTVKKELNGARIWRIK